MPPGHVAAQNRLSVDATNPSGITETWNFNVVFSHTVMPRVDFVVLVVTTTPNAITASDKTKEMEIGFMRATSVNDSAHRWRPLRDSRIAKPRGGTAIRRSAGFGERQNDGEVQPYVTGARRICGD